MFHLPESELSAFVIRLVRAWLIANTQKAWHLLKCHALETVDCYDLSRHSLSHSKSTLLRLSVKLKLKKKKKLLFMLRSRYM